MIDTLQSLWQKAPEYSKTNHKKGWMLTIIQPFSFRKPAFMGLLVYLKDYSQNANRSVHRFVSFLLADLIQDHRLTQNGHFRLIARIYGRSLSTCNTIPSKRIGAVLQKNKLIEIMVVVVVKVNFTKEKSALFFHGLLTEDFQVSIIDEIIFATLPSDASMPKRCLIVVCFLIYPRSTPIRIRSGREWSRSTMTFKG